MNNEPCEYLLMGKAIFCFLRKLTHPEESIGYDSVNIAERMDSTAKMTTMVDERVRKTSV